jgi:hypothetical protein
MFGLYPAWSGLERRNRRMTDLKRLLLGKERTLETRLGVNRETVDHAGEMGAASEADWCAAFAEFLPKRYQVSRAFVIDAGGATSEQIDIVVHDRHFCPLFFETEAGARYVPVESVFAVFEVKQEMTRAHIDYAAKKIASVRQLDRTSTIIIERGERRRPREPFDILGGLLSLESSWSPPFGSAFRDALLEHAAARDERLDLGCALKHGAFELVLGEDGDTVEVGEGVGALMFFLTRLFQRLQSIGSPMAINLREYSRSLQAGELELLAAERR